MARTTFLSPAILAPAMRTLAAFTLALAGLATAGLSGAQPALVAVSELAEGSPNALHEPVPCSPASKSATVSKRPNPGEESSLAAIDIAIAGYGSSASL